jgi:hypothetical protein
VILDGDGCDHRGHLATDPVELFDRPDKPTGGLDSRYGKGCASLLDGREASQNVARSSARKPRPFFCGNHRPSLEPARPLERIPSRHGPPIALTPRSGRFVASADPALCRPRATSQTSTCVPVVHFFDDIERTRRRWNAVGTVPTFAVASISGAAKERQLRAGSRAQQTGYQP